MCPLLRVHSKGVRNIRELVETSSYEKMWMYLPQQTEWVDIGIARTETPLKYDSNTRKINPGMASVMIDIFFLENFFAKNNSIIMYHFHPESTRIECVDKLKEIQEKEEIKDKDYFLSKIIDCGMLWGLPSYRDIQTMIKGSRRFYKLNPHGNILHKVVSKQGIVEYKLTDSGIRKYTAMSDFGFFDALKTIPEHPQAFELSEKCNNHIYNEKKEIMEICSKFDCVITAMCNKMSNTDYTVTFTPF